jgi:hypothetical protein
LVGKPEGSRPPGRLRHRSEDSMKMDLPGRGMGTWTGLIWFRIGMVTGCCECLWVPENVGNFSTSWEPVSFSRSNLPMELVIPGLYQVTSFHLTQPEVCSNLSSLQCMLCVTHSLRFLTFSPSQVWWRVHNTKLLTMQFSEVLTFPPPYFKIFCAIIFSLIFTWLQKLFSHFKGRTEIAGI